MDSLDTGGARQKRHKVNRACYTCRVKKIKCDGLQPCMQCKARRRPCSFSKDGSLEESDYVEQEDIRNDDQPSPPTSKRMKIGHLFSSKVSDVELQEKEKARLKGLTQTLDRLSNIWPGEDQNGNSAWIDNAHQIFDTHTYYNQEPPLPIQYQGFELSAGSIRQHLITLYYRHRYAFLPLIPKRILYGEIDRHGSLITPLLLYSIYAHAAQFSHDDVNKANEFFKKAESMLPDFLDVPRLSTIMSLCLLSLYEPNRHTCAENGKCRSNVFSSMAFQMCFDMGLHLRVPAGHRLSSNDIELRKRVFWTCYCLDKTQHMYPSQPWKLRSQDIDVDFPMLQPEDDVEENDVLEAFVQFIKLMQLSEMALNYDVMASPKLLTQTRETEQVALNFDNKLLQWLGQLPVHLQWTPFPGNTNIVPTQPPSSPFVCHLHLAFNAVELQMFKIRNLTVSKTLQQRCATIATNITQLMCHLVEDTSLILSFSFAAHVLEAALGIHIMNCASENISFARHARFMFQRSVRSLRILIQHRNIPGMDTAVNNIERSLSVPTNNTTVGRLFSPVAQRPKSSMAPTPDEGKQQQPAWQRTNYYSGDYMQTPNNTSGRASMPPPRSMPMTSAEPNYLQTAEENAAEVLSNTFQSSMNSVNWRNQPATNKNPLEFLATDNWTPKQDRGVKDPVLDPMFYRDRLMFPQDTMNSPYAQERPRMDARNNPRYNDMWGNSNVTEPQNENLIYSLWPQNAPSKSPDQKESPVEPQQVNEQEQDREETPFAQFQPSSGYMNIGLGVYASAHQHHTDVIHQHFPGMKPKNPSVRPVMLTHQGQVVVAGSDGVSISEGGR
ncbi:fungal-specific transcription factor domain-containing protein [Radiomyces spectabilis]|uniref:fungal-specific transcription factor domain-containing protein n=1 Tax=Radiomyces spectabilis TaxID=64574 RepID=UPI00221F5A22|nr:fungal-specific transcription factor domain-containing protein [Radiomyces spectabilis]KAI8384308.1 fungal-specific transcription factor domain-containing protein [Radiomyces spectabilis]